MHVEQLVGLREEVAADDHVLQAVARNLEVDHDELATGHRVRTVHGRTPGTPQPAARTAASARSWTIAERVSAGPSASAAPSAGASAVQLTIAFPTSR